MNDDMRKSQPLLNWLGFRTPFDFDRSRGLGAFFGVLLLMLALVGLVAAIGALVTFVSASLGLPPYDVGPTDEAIRNLGLVMAALFGAPFLVWRSVVAQRQVENLEQGQITERITKAVEGLGAEKQGSRIGRVVKIAKIDGQTKLEIKWAGGQLNIEDGEKIQSDGEWQVFSETHRNLEVRVGSIFSLERIAGDSIRDREHILEILCSYIRHNSKAEDAIYPSLSQLDDFARRRSPTDSAVAAMKWRDHRYGEIYHESEAWEWGETLTANEDIQAAMSVIGRINKLPQPKERKVRLNLREVNLQGINLLESNLSFVDFTGSRLDGADLTNATLTGSVLSYAKLLGANLTKAHLQGVAASETDFEGSVMTNADLSDSRIREANFSGAYLYLARFDNADLSECRFEYAFTLQSNIEIEPQTSGISTT